jgi:tetratricopeptide (TPR) repeat protein
MTRDDERLIRLKQQRSKEAVDVNNDIIENFSQDVEAYNRLGRAYMELGQYTRAREAYQRAVEMDPYNAIANRNLRRLNDLKESATTTVDTDKVEPQHFLEEIGKAGVVTLIDLAPKEDRAIVVAGDKVRLKVSGSTLVVESSRGEYMGKVEPRYAQRLVRLMLGGNQYSASVVRSTKDMMTVIIRETYQHPSQAGKLSFPPRGMEEFRSYGSDRLLKLESEDEEEESGYTIIGGDEIEVLPEESEGLDDDVDNEDE